MAEDARAREADASDRDAVIALWTACGLTRPWNDPADDFTRAVDGPTSAVLVREEDGRLVASAMVGYDGHRGWVYYVSVAPSDRGRGLGAAVMADAEAWLRAIGAPKVQLMVRDENTVATGFYAALGYESGGSTPHGKWL